MLARLVEKQFGLSPGQQRRALPFVLLALTGMAGSVLTYTTSSALFLSEVGVEKTPVVYLIIGVISIPFFGSFSALVERTRRPLLFKVSLLVCGASVAAVGVLSQTGWVPVYYAGFILATSIWTIVSDILFPSLLFDCFTVTEMKRIAPLTALGLVAGRTVGGAAAALLANFVREDVLVASPLVFFVAAALTVIWIERSGIASGDAGAGDDGEEERIGVFRLLRENPLIVLLGGAASLFILLACVSEYEYYLVYSEQYEDPAALSAFMGWVAMAMGVMQFGMVTFVTGPVLQRLGVRAANVVYPATSLLSFVSLLVWPGLPAAITTQANIDGIRPGLDEPAVNMSYNGLPHRLVGRARALTEGIFSAAGTAVAGLFLLAGETYLSNEQILAGAVVLSAVFLALRLGIGRLYFKGLVSLLESQVLDLGSALGRSADIAPGYLREIRNLMAHVRWQERLFGVQLARHVTRDQAIERALEERTTDDCHAVRLAAAMARKPGRAAYAARLPDGDRAFLAALAECRSDEERLDLAAALLAVPASSMRENLSAVAASCSDQARLALLRLLALEAGHGHAGLESACRTCLASADQRVRFQAARVLALLPDRDRSANVLKEDLLHRHRLARLCERWTDVIPASDPRWRHLVVSSEDYCRRTVTSVLDTLSALGYRSLLALVRSVMSSPSKRLRASAVEAIASVREGRELVLPVLPLLESFVTGGNALVWRETRPVSEEAAARVLQEAALSGDRWLQAAAVLLAGSRLGEIARLLGNDTDTVVRGLLAAAAGAEPEKGAGADMEKLVFLRMVGLFQSLTLDELLLVSESMAVEEIPSGGFVCREGEKSRRLFIVYKGSVRVSRQGQSGPLLLARLGPGNFFGELSMLDDSPMSATVEAEGACTLFSFKHELFRGLMVQCPGILVEMCGMMSHRLRRADEQLGGKEGTGGDVGTMTFLTDGTR